MSESMNEISWTPWVLVEVKDDNGDRYVALECEGTLGGRRVLILLDLALLGLCLARGGAALDFLDAERAPFAEALIAAQVKP